MIKYLEAKLCIFHFTIRSTNFGRKYTFIFIFDGNKRQKEKLSLPLTN
jgi:hypothetical protein